MPFPRTWTEELVAEWLHLEGYLVEANMPVMVTRAGGRLEADVVGAKISKRTLDIKHVEVGAPAGGRGSIRNLVGEKFSSKMEKAIRSYFKRKFRPVGKVAYRKVYVATYSTEPVRDEFRRLGIEVVAVLPKNWTGA